MNHKEAIDKLKKEATTNPTMSAVLHVFALRKRARNRITVEVLGKAMRVEGFLFGREQYQAVLQKLAEAGFGQLKKDHKGQIRALENISVTFKSLGEAVCNPHGAPIKGFRPRTRFVKVAKQPEQRTLMATPHPTLGVKVTLTFLINNKAINVTVPDSFTADEIGTLVDRLQHPDIAS